MSDLNHNSKVHGVVTLRSGKDDSGLVTIEIWFKNNKIASWPIEYVYDFLGEAYMENQPKTDEPKNYLDSGRRYNQCLTTNWLGPYLHPESPKFQETIDKIKAISIRQE